MALDFLLGPYGLEMAGWVMAVAGIVIFLNGVLGMLGGCKESRPTIKSNMYLSILQILVMLVVLILLMTGAKKVLKSYILYC